MPHDMLWKNTIKSEVNNMNGELTNAIDKIVEKFGIAIDWTDKNALPIFRDLCRDTAVW